MKHSVAVYVGFYFKNVRHKQVKLVQTPWHTAHSKGILIISICELYAFWLLHTTLHKQWNQATTGQGCDDFLLVGFVCLQKKIYCCMFLKRIGHH